ncbi:hypothetical protein IWW55_001068 [Coemansia sp. RSA 2706]|nr:hypothetical protein IWW54_005299 [Coemansia sp. RSA 2705]KAJ2307246.1 hypothetical protein IWW55_001068 [Coemansia sp. RSA 2706]KAJ2320343.1 hypothetical protein IWW52_001431 [Coemansia sp. RSA 2704]KAJ2328226.1 hypothetical protein IWW51_001309 [Coemansia sp. RSA 2702]KAJ2731781.1 hypothetical protein H4R23_003000 [Coemansia sp. Cherry 401B]
MAVNVERTEQFVEILRESSEKLVVVDFYSTTCPPCLVVDQILGQLASQYPTVAFYKVDVKKFSDVAMQCRISATPTLQFFRKGRSINEVKGANKTAIVQAIDAGLSDNGGETAAAFGVVGHSDLTRLVLKTKSECLNQDDDHPMDNIFTEGASRLQSDVDEQLVIHVSFNQPIRLHSLMLKAPLEHAPRSLKLFVNRTDVGFDDAEAAEATQQIEMTKEIYERGGVVNLRYVRFQNVNSLSIFVADNLGDDDVTAISQLAFIGTAINSANVSDIRQGEEGHSH